ncbi:MAG: DNA topoisomerase, partial [Patescibacteria group bacterium]
SPSRTMSIAQKLYENGYITYMRTDSTNLGKEAIEEIKSVVTKKFGAELFSEQTYKSKIKNAQEAHEAIRPTHAIHNTAGKNSDEEKLYQLIWARTVASQMVPSTMLKTRVLANVTKGTIPDFQANGSRILSPGWLLADPKARGEDVEIPKISEGDRLKLIELNSELKQTEPPNRYTEAGLIKELEKRGIGRPSTYASIIQTIQTRGYVDKENKALKPTDTGDIVSTFLENNFGEYISDNFTAEMEENLDKIANGEKEYTKVLKDFYGPFQKDVKSKNDIEKITNLGDAPEGVFCPKCEAKMIIKLGRSGKFLSCSTFPDCPGARTMEGREMEGPKETGEACPKCEEGKLVEREGKFGKFISCNRYPKCKFIREDEEAKKARDTGVVCPICKKGTMTEKRGRFGIFYSCSSYPGCKHIIKSKPTGKICGYMKEGGPCV